MVMTTEEKADYKKAWYQANKAKIITKSKVYREAHKFELCTKRKVYRETPAGKKSNIINEWKYTGLIHDDYHELYESYLQSTHCDVCKSEYKDTFDRCMDHDHETGLYRQFLCRHCNSRDHWKEIISKFNV